MRFLLFLTVVLGVLSSIHLLFWLRLVRDTALPAPWKAVATTAIVVLGSSIPGGIFLNRFFSVETGRYFLLIPFVWLGMMVLLLSILVGADMARILAAGVGKVTGHGAVLESPERRVLVARLVGGGAGLAVFGLAGLALRNAHRPVAIRTVEVVLARLPRELSGFTIAHLSDLHVGLTRGRDWVRQIVERVNRLEPDLIAITGDLLEGIPDRLRDEVAPLAELSAPHGCFFVTGNHDYFSGFEPWVPELRRLGIVVLQNRSVAIDVDGRGFRLAGINDHEAERFGGGPNQSPGLDRALSDRRPGEEVVLLAHQPRAVLEAARRDVGLVLSGHTHGGQLWPWMYFVGLQQPYISGLHQHGERTQIYVSQGTGHWGPPMRLGSEAEIALLRLVGRAA